MRVRRLQEIEPGYPTGNQEEVMGKCRSRAWGVLAGVGWDDENNRLIGALAGRCNNIAL